MLLLTLLISVCHALRGARQFFFHLAFSLSFFGLFSFLRFFVSFFVVVSLVFPPFLECVCCACRIQYDDMALNFSTLLAAELP